MSMNSRAALRVLHSSVALLASCELALSHGLARAESAPPYRFPEVPAIALESSPSPQLPNLQAQASLVARFPTVASSIAIAPSVGLSAVQVDASGGVSRWQNLSTTSRFAVRDQAAPVLPSLAGLPATVLCDFDGDSGVGFAGTDRVAVWQDAIGHLRLDATFSTNGAFSTPLAQYNNDLGPGSLPLAIACGQFGGGHAGPQAARDLVLVWPTEVRFLRFNSRTATDMTVTTETQFHGLGLQNVQTISAADLDGDGLDEILVGTGALPFPMTPARVEVFSLRPVLPPANGYYLAHTGADFGTSVDVTSLAGGRLSAENGHGQVVVLLAEQKVNAEIGQQSVGLIDVALGLLVLASRETIQIGVAEPAGLGTVTSLPTP